MGTCKKKCECAGAGSARVSLWGAAKNSKKGRNNSLCLLQMAIGIWAFKGDWTVFISEETWNDFYAIKNTYLPVCNPLQNIHWAAHDCTSQHAWPIKSALENKVAGWTIKKQRKKNAKFWVLPWEGALQSHAEDTSGWIDTEGGAEKNIYNMHHFCFIYCNLQYLFLVQLYLHQAVFLNKKKSNVLPQIILIMGLISF